MRIVQIALFLLCLQAGIGFIVISTIYGDAIYYESEITNYEAPSDPAQTEEEQRQASISGMSQLWDIVAWGWIIQYFQPLYSNDVGVQAFVDKIIFFFQSITSLLVTIALVEFVRNHTTILK